MHVTFACCVTHSETRKMIERKVKTVRSLERGLDVLLEVQARRAVSLHELHQTLGLPKATLLRMLSTLGRKGLVWQRLADGAYLPHSGRLAVNHAAHISATVERIAEIASPHLKALSKQVAWPSVLAVPRLDHVEIIETNSPLFRLDNATLGPIGVKLSYIHTATGRAYLSACGDAERDAIIARLRPDGASDESEAELRDMLTRFRAQGYASRDPLHSWPDRSRQLVLRDGRRSLGVPIMVSNCPVAAINVTWPGKRGTDEAVIARHLQALQHTAQIIGQQMEAVLQ